MALAHMKKEKQAYPNKWGSECHPYVLSSEASYEEWKLVSETWIRDQEIRTMDDEIVSHMFM